VTSVDAMSMCVGVVGPFAFVLLGTWEAASLMWDVKSTVTGSLHCSKYLVAFGAAYNTDIQSGFEWTLPDLLSFVTSGLKILADVKVLSSGFTYTLVEFLELQLFE